MWAYIILYIDSNAIVTTKFGVIALKFTLIARKVCTRE